MNDYIWLVWEDRNGERRLSSVWSTKDRAADEATRLNTKIPRRAVVYAIQGFSLNVSKVA